MKLVIKSKLVQEIFLQGQEESPIEACGYLAGNDVKVTKRYPMTNVDASNDHFSLDPKEQFAVLKDARNDGLKLLAVYHTHPETPARPSEEDIRLAYDSRIIYVIASLIKDNEDIKAFRIIDGKVEKIKLEVE